ncbi:hypothetical protein T05_14379 [Trichinella murrelli]|uniref:Uncharacterized protein n=1 Tax=Trichinella murrelli TaxID=144512 RepID=A0A0V0SZF4_9BILA|nr:hypothetical protein T05_14379 [Trichinella murrelli]
MLQTHKYHINTAITETCIKQPFTISYMLEFICMLKASKIDILTLSLLRKAPFIDSVKLTVARYLRSMTTQDRNFVETKQSYSCIHFHRKMHRLLKALWSNSNAEMNALAIIQRLAAVVEDTKRLAKSHCLILTIAKSSEVANVLE